MRKELIFSEFEPCIASQFCEVACTYRELPVLQSTAECTLRTDTRYPKLIDLAVAVQPGVMVGYTSSRVVADINIVTRFGEI